MNNLRIHYALTADDFYEFQMAYIKHRRMLTPASQRGMRSPILIIWLGLLALIFILLLFMNMLADGVPSAPAVPSTRPFHDLFVGVLPYVVAFLLILAFVFIVGRSRFFYRRYASQSTRVGEPRELDISDAQLTLREPYCTSTMQWPHFLRFVETKSTFVLFSLPRMGHIIPKRAFPSQESLQEFRAFAQAHIGPGTSGFPPVLPPPVVTPPASSAS